MKRQLILALAFLSIIGTATAQESNISNKLAVGFQLNQYQKDFGFGLNFTSPYVVYDKIALRVRGNLMFYEHVKDNETVWSPYSNVTIGLVGGAQEVGGFMRLYGEGGVIGIIPSSEFSSEDVTLGGYGLFGFEFYFNQHASYFLEVGGIGTGAKADKIENQPIYSNGLLLSVGFRGQL